MANKKPLALYGGLPQELTSGDDLLLQQNPITALGAAPKQYADYGSYALTTGEAMFPRVLGVTAGGALTSGTVYLVYFTPNKTESINNIKVNCVSAAAATPTLCRMGIYSEDGSGNLTQLVITASTATMFSSAGFLTVGLTSTWSKTAGVRYACGLIVVSSFAMPTFYGLAAANAAAVGTMWGTSPRIFGVMAGQTDLPASIAVGSIINAAPRPFYAEFTP